MIVPAVTGKRVHAGRLAVALLLVLVTATAVRAHITLRSSTPARDAVISEPPAELRLEFSGRIEERYTSLTLIAPNAQQVPLGRVTFVAGSDRIITAIVPRLAQAGVYTVRWRTAGADGHVLDGSYTFTVEGDDMITLPVDTQAAALPHHAEHDHPADTTAFIVTRDAFGRFVHFAALLLLLGAVALRVLLLPRLTLTEETAGALRRRAWRAISAAAVLLGVAAVLRLWFQSVALHGADRAWNTQLLSIMLTETSWGRAWMVQVVLFALLGAAIAWARPGRDAIAARVVVIAALGLAAIPGMAGHAAGVGRLAWIVVANDALHVAAGGAWLGLLAMLMVVALPTIHAREPDAAAAGAHAVNAFSPLALTAAALLAATGVINTLLHLDATEQLWTTDYGLTLLVKVGLVALIVIVGFTNWRIVRPRLAAADARRRLRWSAGAELFLALLVLAVTSILTGLPRP